MLRIVFLLLIPIIHCSITLKQEVHNNSEIPIKIRKLLEGDWIFHYEENLNELLATKNLKIDDQEIYNQFLKKLKSEIQYFKLQFFFEEIPSQPAQNFIPTIKWQMEYKIDGREKKEEKSSGYIKEIRDIKLNKDLPSFILSFESHKDKIIAQEEIKILFVREDLIKVIDINKNQFFFLEKEKK